MPMRPLLVLAAGLAAVAAQAETLPTRKAGLWESKKTGQEGTTTVRQCVDAATDQQMQGIANTMGNNCAKKQLTKTATGYVHETNCKMGAITVEGKSVFTGDFNTSVRTEADMVMTGLPGNPQPKASHFVIEARWLGPCEAGQKPGDIIMSDGKVLKMPGTAR